MNELIEKMDISNKSKDVYLSLLRRLKGNNFKLPIKNPQKHIYVEEFFTENFEKISTRLDMLNLVIVLRKALNLKNEKLIDYRNQLVKQRLERNIDTMNEKKKTLITLEEFNKKLDKLHNQKNYKGFIVNFLWSRYGVRNKDVDVEIVRRKQDIKTETNYLYLVKNRVEYIRNDYKTFSTYGKKTCLITDEIFVSNVRSHGVGKVLEGKQIGNALRKLTIDGYGEADIFKMVISECVENKDTERINELSDTRGTNINTIRCFYNLNAERDVIREI